jgi:predicted dinucleotide-binding enzyme
MNLGIIGAGSLGTALGQRLSGAGHAILYGTGAEPKPAAALDGAEVGTTRRSRTCSFSRFRSGR